MATPGHAGRFAGMRPPRRASVSEAVVDAVARQQLSFDVSVHLLDRLARRFGPRVRLAGAPPGFPGPEHLAAADPTELRAPGICGAETTTVVSLGRWSAEYVLVCWLGRLHLFPGDDAGARNSLRRCFGLAPDAVCAEVAAVAAAAAVAGVFEGGGAVA